MATVCDENKNLDEVQRERERERERERKREFKSHTNMHIGGNIYRM